MADSKTLTLSDFLLARIAEDEDSAREAGSAKWGSWNRSWDNGARDIASTERLFTVPEPMDEHVARHNPARVLVECEAKRRIVEMQATNDEDRHLPGFHYKAQMIERVLRALAAVYADHPDYRQEWRP